jgi:hypothetical protein
MQVTIELPDDIAQHLQSRWGPDVPRGVLETIATEGYRSGELSHAQVMRLLGLTHRTETDAFLKRAGIDIHYGPDELEHDRAVHDSLGLR